ncbi:MAG: SIS domain-containing protein [Dysgonamonadaceae bacterium]|jgi:D-sedoheptulose 7-phosphate isomerase|nr:SIS domain-containing protein [Dysgonamonadaceae bacterium]
MINNANYISSHENNIKIVASLILDAVDNGGTVFTCGNGGSAATAAHFTCELMVKMEKIRRPIASVCLNADVITMTAIGNDFGFDKVFSRQIEGLMCNKDLLICFSTSGESKNIIEALELAKASAFYTILFTGNRDSIADITIRVESTNVQFIQEAHDVLMHKIVEQIEERIN